METGETGGQVLCFTFNHKTNGIDGQAKCNMATTQDVSGVEAKDGLSFAACGLTSNAV